MIRRKLLLVFLITALVSSFAFASGQKEATAVSNQKVSIWSFNLTNDALKEIQAVVIKNFMDENPNITVEWQNIPYAGYREKLLTAAAGSSLPDIFIDGYNMLGTYQGAGIIQNMTEYVSSWDGWDEIQSSLRDLTVYEGNNYGFPFRTKVYPVLINTKIFEEVGLDPNNPPETWAEAIAAAKKMLVVKNGVVTRMGSSGFVNAATLSRGFDMFVQQDGGDFLLADGTPAFNDQHGLNALKFLVDLYHTQWPSGTAPLDESSMDAFVAGKSGMAVLSSYDAVQTALQTGNKDFHSFAKVIAPFRSGNPGDKPVSFFDGDMLFMSSKSPSKDAAWKFIQYFYQPENFMVYVKANKAIPIYDSVLKSDYMNDNPLLKDLMTMQQYGGKLASSSAYRSARNYLADEIEKSISAGQDLKKTLDIAESRWLREIEDLK